MKYSNTYNVFVKIFNDNLTNREIGNSDINEMSKKAFENGKKFIISISKSGIIEEVIFYDKMVFCFALLKSYRILYNYFSQSEIGVSDDNDYIDEAVLDEIHFINDKVGDNKLCTVLNTNEAFYDYTTKNYLPINTASNVQLFSSFAENLTVTNIDPVLIDNDYGVTSLNPDLGDLFTYIYFNNIIIITSYSTKSFLNKFTKLKIKFCSVLSTYVNLIDRNILEKMEFPELVKILLQIDDTISDKYFEMLTNIIHVRKLMIESPNLNIDESLDKSNIMIQEISRFLDTL